MSTIGSTNNSKESPTQKADDVRAPFDGPHPAGATKNKNPGSESPAYVVAVSKRDKADEESDLSAPKKYDPQALKAKARGLLKNGNIDPEQRRVLNEILGPEETTKPALEK